MHRLLLVLFLLCCFFPAAATAYAEEAKRYKEWYELGLLHLGSPDGNEYFKKAVEANPDFAPAWYWRGFDAVQVGHDKDAIAYFEKFLKFSRNDKQEAGRIKVATAALAELRSGKQGEEVRKIRMQG